MVKPSGIVMVFTRPRPPCSADRISDHGVPRLMRYVPGLMLRSVCFARAYSLKKNGDPTSPALCIESAAAPKLALFGTITLIGAPVGVEHATHKRTRMQRRRELRIMGIR